MAYSPSTPWKGTPHHGLKQTGTASAYKVATLVLFAGKPLPFTEKRFDRTSLD
tara:strand:+ start:177 stop:335 length:159 start_codon:yes stop_codon:yes gene_type:complete